MKSLRESLFDKNLASKDIMYHPKTRDELVKCIENELNRQGPNANLNIIDVSKITDMSKLFVDVDYNIENIDISDWDVSSVRHMYQMFYGCKKFNSDLSRWDVSDVTIMNHVFYECKEFNSDLSKWDVSKVISMSDMFHDCESFDSDLRKWNVSKVIDMSDMFYGCNTLKKLKKIPWWYKEK